MQHIPAGQRIVEAKGSSRGRAHRHGWVSVVYIINLSSSLLAHSELEAPVGFVFQVVVSGTFLSQPKQTKRVEFEAMVFMHYRQIPGESDKHTLKKKLENRQKPPWGVEVGGILVWL